MRMASPVWADINVVVDPPNRMGKRNIHRRGTIGKWHLQNHTDKGTSHFPEKHGFDINIAGWSPGFSHYQCAGTGGWKGR